jgi:elongation factor P
MVLMLDGAPQMLEEFHVSGTAQTRHKLHAWLRHLKTGRLTDHTFPEGERLPVADVQHRRVQFSYPDGQDCVFSDVESFEDLTLSAVVSSRKTWSTAPCCSTGACWTLCCRRT